MTEIKPEDLIITTYVEPKQGGMHVYQPDSGVKVYHKPSEITVKCDDHRSQHKNKNECIVILKDLLTPFTEGDIVVTEYGLGEVLYFDFDSCWFKLEDGVEHCVFTDQLFHTEEGYKYVAKSLVTEELDALDKEYEEKRKGLIDKLRSL